MVTETDFIAQDFYLENPETRFNLPKINESGYHAMFWWYDIPLGHLYISKQNFLSHDDLMELIWDKIQPVVLTLTDGKVSAHEVEFRFFLENRALFAEVMNWATAGLVTYPETQKMEC